eukprot:PhF_6_TR21156/c0_g1_i1/m.30461
MEGITEDDIFMATLRSPKYVIPSGGQGDPDDDDDDEENHVAPPPPLFVEPTSIVWDSPRQSPRQFSYQANKNNTMNTPSSSSALNVHKSRNDSTSSGLYSRDQRGTRGDLFGTPLTITTSHHQSQKQQQHSFLSQHDSIESTHDSSADASSVNMIRTMLETWAH